IHGNDDSYSRERRLLFNSLFPPSRESARDFTAIRATEKSRPGHPGRLFPFLHPVPYGTIQGNTYAWSMTRTPTRQASTMLWRNTYRRMSPSSPCWFVATPATTILCASIILPMTPPELFDAAARRGEIPTCSAVIC